jgi:hypothetical protein
LPCTLGLYPKPPTHTVSASAPQAEENEDESVTTVKKSISSDSRVS